MALSRAVTAFIDRHRLLPPGPVVIAFSGGPDSLCLLHLLADHAAARGWHLVAVHLDHGLRPESAAEVALVRALAAARDIPLRCERVDVPALAAARGWSIEAAARVARYRFLAAVATDLGGAPVATGHTQDDQAETLLLRLARGTGLTGLRAMQPATLLPPATWEGVADSPPLRVVRPLLTTSRAAVEAELARRGLTPVRDPSNLDPAYARNRLRHGLLAAWRALDPAIAARLARTAEALAADEAYLVAATERAWATLEPADHPGPACSLDRAGLLAQPLALRRRLLRRAAHACAGRTPGLVTIDAALAAVAAGRETPVDLGGGLVLIARPRRVWIGPRAGAPEAPPPAEPWMTPGASAPLRHDSLTVLPGGAWAVACRRCPTHACTAPLSGRHAHFRPALAEQPLRLRTWQPGDRIALPGLGGRKKLHDLFIDRKVPRADRPAVPLLVTGDTVVWVLGLAVGEPWRAIGTEDEVLCCRVSPTTETSPPGWEHA